MRRTPALATALLLGLPAVAAAQFGELPKEKEVKGYVEPPPPEAPKEKGWLEPPDNPEPEKKKRKKGEVDSFAEPDVPKEKPFPVLFALLGVITVAVAAPALALYYRRFSRTIDRADADAVDTGGGEEEAPAERPPARREPTSAPDKVLGIVRRAGGWVSSGRIAVQAGLDPTEAAQILEQLSEEGLLEEGRDAEGRELFRVPEDAE